MAVSFRDLSADAFERLVRRQVELAFADLPDDAAELPFIGGWPFLDYERAVQTQSAVAALLAVRWFELEAPPWAQPLPLTAEACRALFNGPNQGKRRPGLVGQYGLMMRGMRWKITHVTPFEVFCADVLRS